MLKAGLCIMLLLLPGVAAAGADATVRSEVRQADYTIGSIVTQRLTVETPRGYRLDAGSLPEQGQTGAIELRSARWEVRDAVAATRHHIVLEWQVFVAGDTTRVVPLKPLQLQFVHAGKVLPVAVPATRIVVSSLLPAKMDPHFVQPYPAVAPPPIPLRAAWLALGGGLLGLASAALYFAHHFGWLFQAGRPMHFRAAARDIRRLRRRDSDVRLAMQRLAHAYDAHAGYAVGPERLGMLLEASPGLSAVAQESFAFYRDLQHVFFAGMPPEHDVVALERLARRLARAEAV